MVSKPNLKPTDLKSLVVFLMGPTAIGKTEFALQLARGLPCEIVNVDSLQVYRKVDIGSGKPTLAQMQQVPHHLFNIIEPNQQPPYSVAQFCQDVLQVIPKIHARGKIPLLVGGTMQYFYRLVLGLSQLPAADPKVRAELLADIELHGYHAMHQRLAQVDPMTAARLLPQDVQRVIRAYEIYLLTGKPASALQSQTANRTVLDAADLILGNYPSFPYRVLPMALVPMAREQLHQRIEVRFQTMLQRGLIAEVQQIRFLPGMHDDLPVLKSVGYRQVIQYLLGEFSRQELLIRGIYATRQLAKHQLTWLRRWPQQFWLKVADGVSIEQNLEQANHLVTEAVNESKGL